MCRFKKDTDYQAVFDQAPLGMALYLSDGSLIAANQKYCDLLGYSAVELAARPFDALVAPEDAKAVNLEKLWRSEEGVYSQEMKLVKKDGVKIWTSIALTVKRDAHTETPGYLIVVVEDISTRKQVEDTLRMREAELARAQEIAHLGNWVLEIAEDRITWSDEIYHIFGLTPQQFAASFEAFLDRVHPDDRQREREAIERAIHEKQPHRIEYRIVRPNGEVRDIHEEAEVVYDGRGHPMQVIGTVQDITERKQVEHWVEHIAYHDVLTGLPNRACLQTLLREAVRTGRQKNHPFALLILELVRFREINYTLGHAIGDQLLQQVGTRLCQALGLEEQAARIGNVQFAVLLPDADASRAAAKAKQLVRLLEVPFAVGNITYQLGTHAGISLFPEHGADGDALIRKTDIALNRARKTGQECVIYKLEHDPYKPMRLALLGEFGRAIENGQLKLFCQPKADLRTHAITSVEALVRWQHPQYGLIAPDQFIPLIEPTELIHPLTRWVLDASIRQYDAWRQMGLQLPLAVNLSARNLQEPFLAESIDRMLQASEVAAEGLGLEITESSVMADPGASMAMLEKLSGMGCRLYVDDYGTGYSSLSYLMKLPVNDLKIDHSFTMNMTRDRDAAAIVKSTIDMAHNLNLKVVAEGTADRETWNALSELECDEAQGYFISPPIPARDFASWLDQSQWQAIKPSV